MQTLTWLHLSDIHFHPKTAWRDSSTRTRLLEYLKDLLGEHEALHPDFIFCTGDIAFGETSSAPLSEQYEQAKKFFDQLLIVCGKNGVDLSKERLFLVPGNHDVNRKSVNSDAQKALTQQAGAARESVDAINQRFEDRSTEFLDSIKRLDEYAAFIKDYLPHQSDPDGRVRYACKATLGNVCIGIAGFNSAWTSAGPEDDRNLWLAANWQFNKAAESLTGAAIKIGLIHHPTDWFNSADRDVATKRIAADFDFWLHGHSHNAWVTPVQSHIVIAAGAVGAATSKEFGINLTTVHLDKARAITKLHHTTSVGDGWTIAPVAKHAPSGLWSYSLPERVHNKRQAAALPAERKQCVEAILNNRLQAALQSFNTFPKVWLQPTLSKASEVAKDAKSQPKADIGEIIKNPKSIVVKAPPQYGLTCLARNWALQAWREHDGLWIYLDATEVKPFNASINEAIGKELSALSCSEQDIKCVLLDGLPSDDKSSQKFLRLILERFKDLPVIAMQQLGYGFSSTTGPELPRQFELLYLWSLPRTQIRELVAAFNEAKMIGDEDAVTSRIASDLEVLNLPRSPINCLTLLKACQFDFDDSPVNRTEMIKRVLFILFNVDSVPTYKIRPDLKDCEYVLGYFCAQLTRERRYEFSRDRFLLEIQKYCKDRIIDLDIHVLFDVLHTNSIIVEHGSLFRFKFSYWVFYFAAQGMHHDSTFAAYILEKMRYANYPEIVEFYTGIDRGREDALQILIKDVKATSDIVSKKCGFPDELNPYRFLSWTPSETSQAQMQAELANGVLGSNLPAAIKDQYVDQRYDPSRPYDQTIKEFLSDDSLTNMFQTMRAGARALRNSDYVRPEIKRQLLTEILNCWHQTSKVLLSILPPLAKNGRAVYDGAGFVLVGDFGSTTQERAKNILTSIPANVVAWSEDDLFSKKMGPLLIDQLDTAELTDISRHELILLLIRHRPRDWHKTVQKYITTKEKNSFYLNDACETLRAEYRYGFANHTTLQEIEYLIKMVITKHVTGDRAPGPKTIEKTIKRLKGTPIPEREVGGFGASGSTL